MRRRRRPDMWNWTIDMSSNAPSGWTETVRFLGRQINMAMFFHKWTFYSIGNRALTLFGSYAPAYFISYDSYAREIAFEYHPRRYCRAILRFPFFLSQKRAIRAESRLIGADLRGRRNKKTKTYKEYSCITERSHSRFTRPNGGWPFL